MDAVIENVAPGESSAKLLFLAVDVSRELLLQRRLLKADRLSQLGVLVSGVAHELNNPLSAIAAFAELLKIDTKNPEHRESAEIIHAEAMRAGRVVRTLLDFARQRPRVRQAVAIKDVAERVVALHKGDLKKGRVQAFILIPDDLPAVIGDPQELQQVLLNALANAEQAVAATGRGGKVVIEARRVDDRVVVMVEDTGPGVPPDIIDRVFEPFFTTKGEAGTGLGLAISSGLVKAMSGRMYIHNVEGAGASLDCIMMPKVQDANEVRAMDLLLTQIERTMGFEVGRIGIEAQIENAAGLMNVDAIAAASRCSWTSTWTRRTADSICWKRFAWKAAAGVGG